MNTSNEKVEMGNTGSISITFMGFPGLKVSIEIFTGHTLRNYLGEIIKLFTGIYVRRVRKQE